MSALRPTKRDALETAFLALAKERSDVVSGYDARLLAMQNELAGIESKQSEALEFKEGRRTGATVEAYADDALPADHEASNDADWRARSARIMAFAVAMLRRVARPDEKHPKLVAFEGLFALGVDCASKREVAEKYSLSPERISQRAEATRIRFNLPENQHNKPDAAREKYRAIALMRNHEHTN